ncbi:hypothetical protein sscle_01g005400 [Sclerotinia sclerotiorum 1980 UF-70]|uniref:RING-type E3 ubiquitin transferase n=1 Tax=Sclerotinia sclerotiorum (strain ATCC 18683 / 1980 / Ss-1) TaxID=665079 RepID=A0A1D9PSY1_SCLS1|nr:hypothetical protein sscle_01g005400 [Sclerotinia sclerotiorum 1980 UF-70]
MFLPDMGGSMAECILSLMFFVALVAGQTTTAPSFTPSNDTLPANMTTPDMQLTLLSGTSLPMVRNMYNVAPLTSFAGQGQADNSVGQILLNGSIAITDATSASNLSSTTIAYMSCDPNETSNIDSTEAIIMAGNVRPKGILLYSLYSQECSLTGDSTYGSIYTMVSASDSMALLITLRNFTSSSLLLAKIQQNQDPSSSSSPSQTSNNGGPPPTTAVAMSILYSITGIITLLFLIIIGTGAVRAHRHPERYGPRNAFPGRPRQSRAKGLARAMLETLPIVKFGDPEPGKPGSGDIELENGSVHHAPVATATSATTEDIPKASTTAAVVATSEQSGMGSDVEPSSGANEASAVPKEDDLLQCSICTEDFATGEDVRVLPCHHKYHPACIDPWLLNVSGTCPLCRHDLRPTVTHAQNEDEELPPPLEAHEGETASEHTANVSENGEAGPGHRISRLMHLRHAPPEESIAALRELAREQPQQEGEVSNQDVAEEQSRRTRLAGRLRNSFRIRTRSQAASAAEPSATA